MLASGADTLARAGEIQLPLLAMHGADDTTTFPRGTELLVAGASSADKTKIIWDGMKHEIFNSPGRRDVIDTMRRWLNERLPSAEQP
jgi:alpha-beta hydrolase superfamily lysophospholipase